MKRITIFLLLTLLISLVPIHTKKTYSAPLSIKVLPLLIEFSDSPHLRTSQEMNDFFFSTKEEDKSLRNYYLELTNGTLDFCPGKYEAGDWIKLPRKKAEYNRDGSVAKLAKDVMTYLEKKGVDLKEYDNDGDNFVDYCIFIQAGDPIQYSGSNVFWPHSYAFQENVGYGGTKVYRYNMTSEIFMANKLSPLQIICHEFYHYLGGWDLYSYTKQGSSNAVGPWDIMAESTSFHIFGLSGFSRNWMGWLKSEIIKDSGTYELNAIAGKGERRLYRINIPGTKEYFLLENRFRTGVDAWWEGVPDEGLVIYHIDGAIPPNFRFNDGTPDYPHFAVWVEDPGAGMNKKDAAYSLEDNQITLTPTTNPDSRNYDKDSQPAIFITDISKSGETISFKVEFKYIDPVISVNPDKLDFGKVQKGFKKTISINIENIGVSTLRAKFEGSDTWIIPKLKETFGNQETNDISIDTQFLPIGRKRGKLIISSNGGEISIPISVEVVEKQGDINVDGKIDKYDMVILLDSFGSKKGEEKFRPEADFVQDGIINLDDLVILLRNLD
jgi:M6 family metalloprotease-like protein